MSTGGIQTMVTHLLTGIARRGHICAVLTTESSAGNRHDVVQCFKIRHQGHKHRFKAAVKRVLHTAHNKKQINRVLKDCQPDLIHFHIGPLLDDGFKHLLESSLPCVLTLHSVIQPDFFAHVQEKRFIIDLVNRVGYIVCVSEAVATALNQFTGLKAPLEVIPNGIPVEIPVPRYRRKDRQLLFAGRLWRSKGLDILIRALAALKDIRLLIAGDGPEHDRLLHMAQQLKGSDIELLGNIAPIQLQRLMLESTALVVPSRFEGLGLVALEAMSCGCPVIASDVGGLKEIIVDGQNGLLVPPEDPDSLAKAIQILLGNRGLQKTFSECGLQHVRTNYTIDKMTAAYVNVYRRLLGAHERADTPV